MSNYLYRSSPCNGNCRGARCQFAHSIQEWDPKHPKMMCLHGKECWYQHTTCYFLHDNSYAQKKRYAKHYNIIFPNDFYERCMDAKPKEKPMEKSTEEMQKRLEEIHQGQIAILKEMGYIEPGSVPTREEIDQMIQAIRQQ